MIVNRVELGDVLGLSLPTIDKRVREGMPYLDRPEKGEGHREWRFDTAECIRWLVEQGEKGTKKSDKDAVELRIALAEAGMKEYKLGEMQKVWVHVDDVAELVETQYAVVKSRLQSIPGRLAQLIAVESDPARCLTMLKNEVAGALEAIAEPEAVVPAVQAAKG